MAIKPDADTLKIKAVAIVGRDGDVYQQAALRNLNSHLHRIEVITYDQLIRIAERVISIFSGQEATLDIDDDDIPF